MSEYSCSLPSGTTIWKMWKRNNNAFAVGIRCSNCPLTGRADTHRLPGPMCPKCNQDTLTKFDLPDKWYVGQYVPCDIPGQIGIRWFEVIFKEGPQPRSYSPPDWSNYDRWKREKSEVRV